MDNKKLLSKIRKLMALGNSPNPNEAASAIKRAHDLMREYGLSMKDVALSEVVERDSKKLRCKQCQEYEVFLAETIAIRFEVEFLVSRYGGNTHFCFVGIERMAEVATYAFDVLLSKLNKARRGFIELYLSHKRMSRARKTGLADQYARGWVIGVENALDKLVPKKEVPQVVKEYMEQMYNDVPLSKTKNKGINNSQGLECAQIGFSDGSAVEINPGVSGTQAQLSLL